MCNLLSHVAPKVLFVVYLVLIFAGKFERRDPVGLCVVLQYGCRFVPIVRFGLNFWNLISY